MGTCPAARASRRQWSNTARPRPRPRSDGVTRIMLIHATLPPCSAPPIGSTAPLATMQPSASRTTLILPWRENTPQSSAGWFQPLCRTRSSSMGWTVASRPSRRGPCTAARDSVLAIAGLELGGLVVQPALARDPVGHPAHLPQQGRARVAEQPLGGGGV